MRSGPRSPRTTSPETGANRSLTALTDSTTPNVANCSRLLPAVGKLDEDDVTELVRGVLGDADRRLVAVDADPLVVLRVAQIGGTIVGFLLGSAATAR